MRNRLVYIAIGLFLGVLVTLTSGKPKDDACVEESPRMRVYDVDNLKKRVILQGDTAAYGALEKYFAADKNPNEIYLYSFVMYHRYNYKKAKERMDSILPLPDMCESQP